MIKLKAELFMTSEIFAQLLASYESDTLDFKLLHYDLSGSDKQVKDRKRAQFAKDILAFSNNWRDEPRYIVIGVKRRQDGSVESPGVSSHVDSADLVAALEGLVHPCPRFDYVPVEYNGKQYGVIKIHPDRTVGPFFATRDVGGGDGTAVPLLRKSALYCRRSSKNVEASPEEQKAIWLWFQQGQSLPPANYPAEQVWNQLIELSQLTTHQCNHILILALGDNITETKLAHLAGVDWSMVIDLDSNSQLTGALKYCREHSSWRRAIHVVVPNENIVGDLNRSTCWYFPNGLQVVVGPNPDITYRDWVAKFGKATAAIIEKVAACCSGPTSVVALCENPNRTLLVRRLIEDIVTNFGERSVCVAVAAAGDDWQTLEQYGLATVVPMSVSHFLDGLAAQARVVELGAEHVVQLAGAAGVPKDVSGEDLTYLEEDLEIVHLMAGTRPEDGSEPIRNFLRGAQISWFELGLQADVERDKTADVLRIVEQDLEQRKSTRVNLYHEPGAGGSTIARRILWMLHQRFPAVVLRRCAPRETAERIAWIYHLTGQPILILREGGDIPETEAEQLANLLAGKHLPSVMLQVLRRYTSPTPGIRNAFLRGQLTAGENERFRIALQHEAPARRSAIEQLAAGVASVRTPFIYGLTAFAAGFTALRPYVLNHLRSVPGPQIKVLQFLALAYDYGQQALASAHFAGLLQIPLTRPVDFNKVLCEEARSLLIEQADGRWRPVHQLVSSEILQLTLSSDAVDTRLWKTRLGDLARDFVEFCRTDAPVPPDELQAVLEQVCVRRNDAELLTSIVAGENRFSRLVNDLPTADAKLLLFEQLVGEFPDNPHFWAHLGRYYSLERRDFVKAEESVNRAIALNEADHVLHHMKGMALRSLAYQEISEKKSIDSIVSVAKRASECFARARLLAPDEDYGFISEAQMTLRVMDYARGSQEAVAVLAKETTDPWLREGFERIEDLLETVREQRRGAAPSHYEEECRAKLDVLYGAHDQALQRWDQLLQRKSATGQQLVYAPPIRRQIVRLQLVRCERRWENMPSKQLQRSIGLLEQNIQEEPNEDRNIRLWVQGARFLSPPPSLAIATDRVATWRMRGDSLDAIYYLYVLRILEALDGSAIAADDAQRNIEICRAKAGFRRDRSRSFEWLGAGKGLRSLVHQDQLGGWDESAGFWSNTKPLLRIEGNVSRIHAPQSGEITLRWGIKVFFVPAAAAMAYGRDENRQVSFYLGFSYDGLRAWSVEPV